MRWLLIWVLGSVPLGILVGAMIRHGNPTPEVSLRRNGPAAPSPRTHRNF